MVFKRAVIIIYLIVVPRCSMSQPANTIVVLLFLLRASFGTNNGYRLNLSRDVNAVQLTCQLLNTLNVPQTVTNPVWYFNGSIHDEHPCTKSATISSNSFQMTLVPECEGYLQCGEDGGKDVSLPRLLLCKL